jgi:sodium transport system ATP-binding protein
LPSPRGDRIDINPTPRGVGGEDIPSIRRAEAHVTLSPAHRAVTNRIPCASDCRKERKVERVIEVHQISKVFSHRKRGEVRAVDDVSFTAHPGEIFGVLGPNGAGKTTLLRVLATILAPTAGTATVAGHDIRRDAQRVRTNIGFLTGSAGLYERLTPREFLAYFGELNGMRSDVITARTKDLFDTLDIHEFADRRCDKLSTGQKQRVSIARAILHNPPVLFFDEPTSGLDIMAARTVVGFIRRCRDEGRTVIFSTHIMSEVEALCDRIAIIYQGRLAAIGTLEELRARTGETMFENVFLRLIGEDVYA